MGLIALIKMVRVNKVNTFSVIFTNERKFSQYVEQAKYQAFQALDYSAQVHLFKATKEEGLLILSCISLYEDIEVRCAGLENYMLAKGDFIVNVEMKQIPLY